jgi:hypothetical protein
MLFPKFEIEELKKQEARDLTRFNLDFDLVACLDCHANGHTNGAMGQASGRRHSPAGASRRRRCAASISGGCSARRPLKSVEDFSEFERRAAYFDCDPVTATKKGVSIIERGSQVHDMAEFQELLDSVGTEARSIW